MSNHHSREPNPPNSSKNLVTQEAPAHPESSSQQPTAFNGREHFAETSQRTFGPRSQSFPDLPSTAQDTQSHNPPNPPNPVPEAPRIIVTGSPERHDARTSSPAFESIPRQSRSLVSRHSPRNSCSQPARRSSTPYTRLRSRSQSQETRTATAAAMSSASSSPGNTTTAGASTPQPSTSGTNPSYHLPYAPFPYPMPGNARGSGQGNQGSSNSGK